MNWTTDQQKIIDLRNRNILVSAAAGSGKTAVLVARIISLITEGDSPLDIDRLLIVTFTNAAAAEMKERIGKAIEEKVRENPKNSHLQKQAALIHSAQITTIHSFCLYVIRNHFNLIHLDPSFRIGDEAELTLLKSDVLGELLEEYYEAGDKDFLSFIECFASGKTDKKIEDLVLKLHQFSMSYPWPKKWLTEREEAFLLESIEDMKNTNWMKEFLQYLSSMISDLADRCTEAISLCNGVGGPMAYLPALEGDYKLLTALSGVCDYEEYEKQLEAFSFARLSGKKEEGVREEVKAQVKAIRDEIKKSINDIRKNYFFQTPEEMFLDLAAMKGHMKVLIQITKDFLDAFAKKKQKKNIVDFNDLEHFALNILIKEEEGQLVPSVAADELSEYYDEIMIDEYQDSNFVQETILNSISKERHGKPNLFMVGDVKQSIYKFRLARPEIFMDKFMTYSLEDSPYQRVDLHKNFRSRDVVLHSINFIFEQIMTKQLGNIEYNKEVFLYPGADFPEYIKGVSEDTELLLVPLDLPAAEEEGFIKGKSSGEQRTSDTAGFSGGENSLEEDSSLEGAGLLEEDSLSDEEYTKIELEARVVAARIKELVHKEHGLLVFDKEKKINRRAVYSDIVILLRTMSGWSEVFVETLLSLGIPAHADTQSGYFKTLEIRNVLNLLKIIDNPRQDIPLAGVLHSPIGDISGRELALIRIHKRKVSLYESVIDYAENCKDELSEKLLKFLDRLNLYRKWVSYLPIHELLEKVLEDTDYYNYVYAMPGGVKRAANLDMLIWQAIKFESTSFSGLFHFVRYMEKLDKYDIDYGEAATLGDDNSIRIMSIHKSKGLEFPIVFAAGMGKNFNNQDARGSLLIHPDLGLGPDYLDYENRIKTPTLVKKIIGKLLVLENLGEELRILYVAMTRAKEKLILVGGVKKLEDKLSKWSSIIDQTEKQLPYSRLTGSNTYLDYIIPAVMRHRGCEEILNICNITGNKYNSLYNSDSNFVIKVKTYEEFLEGDTALSTFSRMNKEELLLWEEESFHEDIRRHLLERLEYQYPYDLETKIKAKLTVSELKRLGQVESFSDSEHLITPSFEEEERTPNFIKQNVLGVNIGTLYHTVLEVLPLNEVSSDLEINQFLLSLVDKGKIKQEEYYLLDISKLKAFLESPVAKRMKEAEKSGQLYKERQFVMGVKVSEVNPLLKSDEIVLVQGVIDVYFEEEDGLVLLDYKTDGVSYQTGEEILKNRYKVQLEYYEKALSRLTGKRVKERIIYSFGLQREIML